MTLFNDPTSIVTPEQFERLVLAACARHGLRSDLPEIERFIAEAPSYIASGYFQPSWLDQVLNPSALVRTEPGGGIIIPVNDLNVLAPLTIARYFYPNLTSRLTNLLADDIGLHLWSRGMLLASIQAAAIDPHRRDDLGQLAYVDACDIIRELTGQYPRWQRHFGRTSIIAAERCDAHWNLEFQFPGGFMRVVTA